jgi:hypothetical protein
MADGNNSFEVDPELLQRVYKQRLAEATEQNLLLTAAATQLQNQLQGAHDRITMLEDQLELYTGNEADTPDSSEVPDEVVKAG